MRLNLLALVLLSGSSLCNVLEAAIAPSGPIGHIYVSDFASNSIYIFDKAMDSSAAPRILTSLSPRLDMPRGLAVSRGRLIVANTGAGELLALPLGVSGPQTAQIFPFRFNDIAAIAANPVTGEIAIYDDVDGSITVIDPSPNVTTRRAYIHCDGLSPLRDSNVSQIAYDHSGRIYFPSHDYDGLLVYPKGAKGCVAPEVALFSYPHSYAVTLDANDNIYTVHKNYAGTTLLEVYPPFVSGFHLNALWNYQYVYPQMVMGLSAASGGSTQLLYGVAGNPIVPGSQSQGYADKVDAVGPTARFGGFSWGAGIVGD